MEDDSRSFIHDLKKEWKLFWNNLLDDGFRDEDEVLNQSPLFPAEITLQQIQDVIRNLSRQRQEIHIKLEGIHKEMEELEALHAEQQEAGLDSQATVGRIESLNDLGHRWTKAVDLLTQQLGFARKKEKELQALEPSEEMGRRLQRV